MFEYVLHAISNVVEKSVASFIDMNSVLNSFSTEAITQHFNRMKKSKSTVRTQNVPL